MYSGLVNFTDGHTNLCPSIFLWHYQYIAYPWCALNGVYYINFTHIVYLVPNLLLFGIELTSIFVNMRRHIVFISIVWMINFGDKPFIMHIALFEYVFVFKEEIDYVLIFFR